MRFNFKEKWSWSDLEEYLSDDKLSMISEIQNLISIDEANFLCFQFTQLEKPEEIKNLSRFQTNQQSLGAWVQGLLPDQFIDEKEIPIPNSIDNIVSLLWDFAKQREMNIAAIKKFEAYPLDFKSEKYEQSRKISYPDSWNVTIDLSAVKKTIDLIKKGKDDFQEALSIAELKSNQEMMEHRKSLDYLPDPKTTTDDLANLLLKAVSVNPLDLIWKWLNPMNYFDYADIFMHLTEYEELITQIELNEVAIKEEVLGTIFEYIKLNIDIDETFALTIGFGIQGWATDNMFGLNIEYAKDDFNSILGTMGHEFFHRLQTKICSPTNESLTFDELTSGPFDNPKDNKFYEVLSYIMLEGTGEVIKYELLGKTDSNLELNAKEGLSLLDQIYNEIYLNNNLENAKELLHKGLISNGPFYSLGKFIADAIVQPHPKSFLGEVLNQGTISFFTKFINEKSTGLKISNKVAQKILKLHE